MKWRDVSQRETKQSGRASHKPPEHESEEQAQAHIKRLHALSLTNESYKTISRVIAHLQMRHSLSPQVCSAFAYILESLNAITLAEVSDYVLHRKKVSLPSELVDTLNSFRSSRSPRPSKYGSPLSSDTDTKADTERWTHLTALMNSVNKNSDYDTLADSIITVISDVREQAAATLLPALKAELQRRPHSSFDEKKELVKWANAELRRFGLAIKSPKTGSAASLVADKGNHPDEGRFQLRSEGLGGKVETFSTPKLDVLLAGLELIEAPQREEGLSNWADRAKATRTPRRRS